MYITSFSRGGRCRPGAPSGVIIIERIGDFGQNSDFSEKEIERNDDDEKRVQIMDGFKQKDGIRIDDQPVDGETDDDEQR